MRTKRSANALYATMGVGALLAGGTGLLAAQETVAPTFGSGFYCVVNRG